ncbi:MAG: thioredoxin [Paludibacter sp.]|nr:thioredoxin [Paludibacter sp.]
MVENPSTVVYMTKADFLQKIANYETNPEKFIYLGDKPCIIDFYADWCGPCRRVAPILEELSKEYADKIYIYKINVDKERELAALFGIRSIPSILFVPQTGMPQITTGLYPKAVYVRIINEFLLKN